MPCHVHSASVPNSRRRSSLRLSPPRILAKLNMSNEIERSTQAFLKRACSGRWPMWRLLGMKRNGNTLIIAIEWLRIHKPTFALVNIALDKIAMHWRDYPTAAAARAALATHDVKHRPPMAPSTPALMEGSAP